MSSSQIPSGLYCSEFLGTAKPLPHNCLPTISDVLNCYQLTSQEMLIYTGKKEVTQHQISSMVAAKVMVIWRLAGIPTQAKNKVVELVSEWYIKYGEACKLLKRAHKAKDTFRNKIKSLFDIADDKKCIEQKGDKALAFMKDQRQNRSMTFVFSGEQVTYYNNGEELYEEEEKFSTNSNAYHGGHTGDGYSDWLPFTDSPPTKRPKYGYW